MDEKKLKKLPLGLSTFGELIQENYVYVDKTRDIYQMITSGKYYFLSRPRRFGKSLLISTLEALFSGKKELFKNLWIKKSDWDWTTHPVIKIDFSRIDYRSIDRLEKSLMRRLHVIAQQYKIKLEESESAKDLFGELIDKLAEQNSVVLLIDEYDKPILDYIETPNEAKARREILRDFYGIIKSVDQSLRFVLLTGVSKFAQTSIFSGINNLEDITLDPSYATLLGYTQQEVDRYFVGHIDKLASKFKKTPTEITKKLLEYYDGYQFAENSSKIFNPYSVLTSLKKRIFGNYWFTSGTPTFLIKRIKSGEYALNNLYQPIMSEEELGAFEPEDIKITALLYQAGYLTIKQYNEHSNDYTLDFPNLEVTRSFNFLMAGAATQLTNHQTKSYAAHICQALATQNLQELQNILQRLFNEMPYTVHVKREFDLQLIIFSVFKLIGIEVDPEVITSLGRADLVVSFPKLVYIIELKINKSAHEALKQIQDRQYYDKYENTDKIITLLGINFDTANKTISVKSVTL